MKMSNDFIIHYDDILLTAMQVLQFSTISKLPIDVFKIIEPIPNLKKCSYSRFAHRNRISIQETCLLLCSDYGTYVSRPKTNQHIIFYNDTTGNEGLLRFTFAHELAHFYLSHSEKLKKFPMANQAIESEANFFARNLLAPMPLVNRILTDYALCSQNINRIMQCFHLSYNAAKVRLNTCENEQALTQSLKDVTGFFDRFSIYQPEDSICY